MTICLKCGKESEKCLCEACRAETDIEAFCREIIAFWPGRGENALWNDIAAGLRNPSDFRYAAISLAAELPDARCRYVRVLCVAGNSGTVIKSARPWLYETAPALLESDALSLTEKHTVRALVMDALYKDYRYPEAEEIAQILMAAQQLPGVAYLRLIEFMTTTRRYDTAEVLLEKAYACCPQYGAKLSALSKKNSEYQEKAQMGKQQYMPNPNENAQEARKSYVDFLKTIGISTETHRERAIPTPIPRDQYPEAIELRDNTFDSFVAFDVETTGFDPKIDCIIEIGAIRVAHGEIVETKAFTFQEFMKPYKRSVSPEVQELTGITPEQLNGAKQMWEVFPEFMRFVRDSVLVGYNCIHFDAKFLARAGRYSHIEIPNGFFDVMRYAKQFEGKLTPPDWRLENVAAALGIKNPQAHRALADAVTTARVYLALKAMDGGPQEVGIDDMLSDLDDW